MVKKTFFSVIHIMSESGTNNVGHQVSSARIEGLYIYRVGQKKPSPRFKSFKKSKLFSETP